MRTVVGIFFCATALASPAFALPETLHRYPPITYMATTRTEVFGRSAMPIRGRL